MRAPVLDCYAITPPGVEALTVRELAALGIASEGTERGGVTLRTDLAGVAAANLELRTASRVVVRVGTFHASAFHELERRAGRLPWEAYVPPGSAVSFRVTSRKSKLYHQDGIAERLAGAVARRAAGAHPAAGADGQAFVVRLFRDECTVSADASGAHPHQRGYRLATAKAPLRETLAAAMLLAAWWEGTVPLADPMCGSGTIPIEAATANAQQAGVADDVVFRRAAISTFAPAAGPGLVVTNPPYGVRVGRTDDLRDLYARLGQVLRRSCAEWNVALLSARTELARQTGLELTTAFSTTNGGLRVRLLTGTVPRIA